MNDSREWLEADGLGGFASGTVDGIRTRRYHALLLAAVTPPTGRHALVSDYEAWVVTPRGRFALSSHRYAMDVIHPDGRERIESFEVAPWPSWVHRLEDGTRIAQEIFARQGVPLVVVSWRLLEPREGVTLEVRPLLSGRDAHALIAENAAFRFESRVEGERVEWHPYADVPGVVSLANATWSAEPDWYRGFLYAAERERGLDDREDLASPGVLHFDLSGEEAAWVLAADTPETRALLEEGHAPALVRRLRLLERARRRTPSGLRAAAASYRVRRGEGRSIIAGYPWFTDWGRDTFIALRGLCLAVGRIDEAREVLLTWAATISEGMVPNRFTDAGDLPEFHAVDASLWFVIAAEETLVRAAASGKEIPVAERRRLEDAIGAILEGHVRGTRFGIHADDDGLLAAGGPETSLTWMDARVDGIAVTPRAGKPVEVQALWLNALAIGARRSEVWRPWHERGLASFEQKFWSETRGMLHDVVDVNGVAGDCDSSLRPNQIFAVGGLPLPLLTGERARRVVDVVERELWTPAGLRTLARGEPGFVPAYAGDAAVRDASYHQGTVWTWLAGPFVEAWVRVHGNDAAARREARERFLAPLLGRLDVMGLGHLAEIADAEPPFTPRGCPFQAWSVGEALRLECEVLAVDEDSTE